MLAIFTVCISHLCSLTQCYNCVQVQQRWYRHSREPYDCKVATQTEKKSTARRVKRLLVAGGGRKSGRKKTPRAKRFAGRPP